jgi:hypothetical protein
MKSRVVFPIVHLRHAAAVAAMIALVIALVIAAGCSPLTEPEPTGTIALVLYLDDAPDGDVSPAPAQVAPDSVLVRVFRGGVGVTAETSRGAAINGAGSVNLTITCVAENDKKVSVELFSGGTMLYFGVDENVDVMVDENTDVMVDARDILIDRVEVTDQLIEPGDPPPDVYWSRVPAASSYLLLESSSPNFEPQFTQSFLTTDTVMTRSRPAGAWYYTVAPLNPYTVGSPSHVVYTYVTTAGEQQPQIDGMAPSAVTPGGRVTLSGQNLDVPGRVWLGTSICPIVSTSETELVFAVPAAGQTGPVVYENLLNDATAPGTLVVQRIAYVTRTDQGVSDSQWYIDLVQNENSLTSGVAVVPLGAMADQDMRVFDVIVVAHDVGTSQYGPGLAQVQSIVASGANVLAVGRGGQAFLSMAFTELSDLGATLEYRPDLYIPDGSLLLFQSPYSIAPLGGSYQVMCQDDQPFSGIDVEVRPASVTAYAVLSDTTQNSLVLFDVEATSQSMQPVHNLYWGYEGDPDRLSSRGRQCVTNLITYLAGSASSVPAVSERTIPVSR